MAAPRSLWKGAIKFGLLPVPVKMVTPTEKSEKYTFNRLHQPCMGRLREKNWCPACNREPASGETVKGYQYEKGKYVVVSSAELEACEIATSHTIAITKIIDDPVDPLMISETGYLLPDGAAAVSAYETMRVALGTQVAIGEMTLKKKTINVAVTARDEGFVIFLLRDTQGVRDMATFERPANYAPPSNEVAMAKQLLSSLHGTFSYERPQAERYTDRVREMLEAKIAGKPVPTMAAPVMPPSAASVFDMLKASLTAQTAPAPLKAVKGGKKAKAS